MIKRTKVVTTRSPLSLRIPLSLFTPFPTNHLVSLLWSWIVNSNSIIGLCQRPRALCYDVILVVSQLCWVVLFILLLFLQTLKHFKWFYTVSLSQSCRTTFLPWPFERVTSRRYSKVKHFFWYRHFVLFYSLQKRKNGHTHTRTHT